MAERPRRTTLTSLTALALLALATAGVGPVAAAEAPAAGPVQVAIAAQTPTGPEGLAILATVDATSTGVQVLAPEAPEGTSAAIHAGTCLALERTVGLIGTISEAGQVQAIVPLPLSGIADGGHVVALHPGLDLATVLACGPVPAVAGGQVVREEPPPDDGECVGALEWIEATEARIDRLDELEVELWTTAADFQLFLNTLAGNIGETHVLMDQMEAEVIPLAALEAHEQLLDAVFAVLEASDELLVGARQVDMTRYQRGLDAAGEARQDLLDVRTSLAELEVSCAGA